MNAAASFGLSVALVCCLYPVLADVLAGWVR